MDNKIKIVYKDFNIPDEFYKKNNIKNLLELSAKNDIVLFENRYKKPKVKDKNKIIKECKKKKKKRINDFSKRLKEITKNPGIIDIKITDINDKYVDDINSIDNLINALLSEDEDDFEYIDLKLGKINILDDSDSDSDYIDVFRN